MISRACRGIGMERWAPSLRPVRRVGATGERAMTVTVVGRWHVPDGQQDLAIAAAQHELDVRAIQPSARRQAHVFQAVDDPAMLLYVAEWSDRFAFEIYRGQGGSDTVEAAISAAGEYL